MKRLIVGCGYLGLRAAERWLNQGDTVHALTRSPERMSDWSKRGIVPHLGDVLNSESLQDLPEVDTLLWAVGWDRQSGATQRAVYVEGLRCLLDAMRGRWQRLIYISSTSVYGQSGGEWVDEGSVCLPKAPNGQVCCDAESLVLDENQDCTTDCPATILRLSGIYGPGRLLARAAGLRAGEPLTGNPHAWLNLIHVDDATAAVVRCDVPGSRQPLFLISDNEPMTREDYYGELARHLNAPPPRFVEAECASQVSTESLNKRCRNLLARSRLNWSLEFPTFREGIPHALSCDAK